MKPFLMTLCLAGVAAPALAAPVALQNATATFSQASPFDVDASADGVTTGGGWALSPNITDQVAAYRFASPVGGPAGTAFSFVLIQEFGNFHTLGRFRLSVTTEDPNDPVNGFADGANSGGDVVTNWAQLTPLTAVATNGTLLSIQGDDSILALHGGTNPNPATSRYTITATTPLTGITGLRLEVIEDDSLPFDGPGRQPSNGNFVLQELQVDAVGIIPEPTSAGLIALGGAMLLRRRRA